MINILTEKLQDEIIVEGCALSINPSHHFFIDFVQGIITKDYERSYQAIMQITNDNMVFEPSEVKKAVSDFATKTSKNSTSKKSSTILFDYDFDSDIIYADFMRCYNIDLQTPIHWHKFKVLLDNLPENSLVSKRISIRSIKSKKQAEKMGYNWDKIKELQAIIAIKNKDETLPQEVLTEIDDLFYNA